MLLTCVFDGKLVAFNLRSIFQRVDYSWLLSSLEAMKRMIQIKAGFEGIHRAKDSLLHCFRWFPDVEIAIVLYVDDAISTDTLNMSHEPALE